ncbi:MAG: type II secretion system F family protein [Deltaproteobacteria bacterium]|nr:type II secretion system F family protein [Deltaproteobacteria bacterium]
MPKYQWVGVDRSGKTIKGVRDAPGQSAVATWLRSQQIRPRKIAVKAQLFSSLNKTAKKGGKVKSKDIVVFARQFATMIDAGLPIVQCLEIQMSQLESPAFKFVLKEVKADVETGSTLADSMKKHPKVFDDLFVNLIAAGEIGGILDTILLRLAAYLEKIMKLKAKVKGALLYPAIVMVVASVVVVVLMVFVIPVFEKMFKDFGDAELPGPTRMVINFSKSFKDYLPFGIVALIVIAVVFQQVYKNPRGRLMIDKLTLQLPIFGPLLRKVAVARFTRTLGTMLTSGVPILDALNIVAKTAGNKVIENALMQARLSISEGQNIVDPLGESKVFPSMVVQMIGVGEATGAMDAMLSKIADFYDDEVDTAVDALTSAIEPVMIVFLGGLIGGLVVAMYLPVFKMAGSLGG